MKKSVKIVLAIMSGIFTMVATEATSTTLTIDARSNIYGAGHGTVSAPGGGGAGILPLNYSFSAGADQILKFSSVSGLVSYNNGGNYWGPDGAFVYPNTNLSSYNGLSGINNGGIFYLVGVFLTDTEPTGLAPASLDFGSSGYGTNFLSLSPEINQLFFIGDGLTGTGSGITQIFYIPNTATRLFLGFADGFNFQGLTGQYHDNIGSLTATFDIKPNHMSAPVPEPSSLFLFGSGIFGAVLFGKKFRSNSK